MNVTFHYSSFLAPKLSHPTIKAKVYFVWLQEVFSFRRMLDNTRLLKAKSWHHQPKLFHQQRRLWVKRSCTGCVLQFRNSAAVQKLVFTWSRSWLYWGRFALQTAGCGWPVPNWEPNAAGSKTSKEGTFKKTIPLSCCFLQYFNTALKC